MDSFRYFKLSIIEGTYTYYKCRHNAQNYYDIFAYDFSTGGYYRTYFCYLAEDTLGLSKHRILPISKHDGIELSREEYVKDIENAVYVYELTS